MATGLHGTYDPNNLYQLNALFSLGNAKVKPLYCWDCLIDGFISLSMTCNFGNCTMTLAIATSVGTSCSLPVHISNSNAETIDWT